MLAWARKMLKRRLENEETGLTEDMLVLLNMIPTHMRIVFHTVHSKGPIL